MRKTVSCHNGGGHRARLSAKRGVIESSTAKGMELKLAKKWKLHSQLEARTSASPGTLVVLVQPGQELEIEVVPVSTKDLDLSDLPGLPLSATRSVPEVSFLYEGKWCACDFDELRASADPIG